MSRARRVAAPRSRRPAPRRRAGDRPALAPIASTPDGPSVGAFFDFDGTLLAGYSIVAFLGERLRRREIGVAELGRVARSLFDSLTGEIDNRELLERGLAEWRDRSVTDMDRLGQQLFERSLEPNLFPEMRAIVEAHRRKGHTLVIASSATSLQVLPAARFLNIAEVLCTRLEAQDGRLTGRIDGTLLWGPAKAVAAQALAARRGIDLGQSYFYADGNEDAALMHLVGQPRPVNPQPRLARVAARRGWPIQRFSSRGPLQPVAVLRNLAAIAGFLPVLAAAAAMRALTGDRRQAANLLTSTLPDLVLSFGRVQLNVVGEEHLWSHRPAVFIWNHRNVFDAQIVGKLVNRDFGAVAKKELATDPLFALASRFMEIAFVDRQDHRAALAALEPVTRRLREGCSLVIAPEGTRVAGTGLGEFKKGAFRMAMAAGVPIVPIVIRNAEDLGARTAMMIRPGSVDIAVLPPVPVRRWTRANLDSHIAAIRQSFVDTLAEWPKRDRDVNSAPGRRVLRHAADGDAAHDVHAGEDAL